jgi:ABC-type dipeptide/oligopeptide/nickel transport system permease component
MGRRAAVLKKTGALLARSAVVLLGISFITFLILYLSPKNPAELWLVGTDGNAGIVSDEAIAQQEKLMGLDKPFIVQYGRWLGDILKGDMGTSFTSGKPVSQELVSHMWPTAVMTASCLGLTILISVPLGVFCAARKDGVTDNIARLFSFVGISIPSFVLSLVLLWAVCFKLGWLPIIPEDGISGLILPIIVLTVQCSAKMTRQVRAIVLEQLDSPYVEGAVMRGVSRRRILFAHVLRNSAAPILTCAGVYVGVLLGGSAVIEGIFSVNGLGKLAVSSVGRMDYNVLLGFVLWCAAVYLAVNLAVDIISAMIDPRIRYGHDSGRRE